MLIFGMWNHMFVNDVCPLKNSISLYDCKLNNSVLGGKYYVLLLVS